MTRCRKILNINNLILFITINGILYNSAFSETAVDQLLELNYLKPVDSLNHETSHFTRVSDKVLKFLRTQRPLEYGTYLIFRKPDEKNPSQSVAVPYLAVGSKLYELNGNYEKIASTFTNPNPTTVQEFLTANHLSDRITPKEHPQDNMHLRSYSSERRRSTIDPCIQQNSSQVENLNINIENIIAHLEENKQESNESSQDRPPPLMLGSYDPGQEDKEGDELGSFEKHLLFNKKSRKSFNIKEGDETDEEDSNHFKKAHFLEFGSVSSNDGKKMLNFEAKLEEAEFVGKGKFKSVYKIPISTGKEPHFITSAATQVEYVKHMGDTSYSDHDYNIAKLLEEAKVPNTLRYLASAEIPLTDGLIRRTYFMQFLSGGDLRSLRKPSSGKLTEEAFDRISKIGKMLCHAISLMHENKIVHRDIKPDNIFMDDSGDPFIGDFGIAVSYKDGKLPKKESAAAGTVDYSHPAYLTGEEEFNRGRATKVMWPTLAQAQDHWGFGLTLLDLLNAKSKRPWFGGVTKIMSVTSVQIHKEIQEVIDRIPTVSENKKVSLQKLLECSFDKDLTSGCNFKETCDNFRK